MTATMTEPFEVVCSDTSVLPRAEWLVERRRGEGSSDAAAAMEMSPWQSSYSLWCDKSGLLPDREDNERFLWGRLHEPNIIAEAERRGWIRGPVSRNLMVRSIAYPWMLANPDALTPYQVVEAKTADGWDEDRWDEGVPDHYVIQAHHLMIVTGRRECVFPVLFGGNNLRCFIIEFDDALAAVLIEAVRKHWERVLTNNPPDPDGSEASMHALRERFIESIAGKAVELDADIATPILDMRAASADLAKSYGKDVDGAKALLMEMLGENEVGLVYGEVAVTWKKTASGSRSMRFPAKKKEKQ